jgi:hypothetical protein
VRGNHHSVEALASDDIVLEGGALGPVLEADAKHQPSETQESGWVERWALLSDSDRVLGQRG